MSYIYIVILSVLLLSCTPEPEPINFGKEECINCKMTITDRRFGAEILTKKGKALKFDAVECMVDYFIKKQVDESNIHSMYSISFNSPGELLNVESSWFVQTDSIPSPMALNISTYLTKDEAKRIRTKKDGKLMDWNQVKAFVWQKWNL